MYNNNKSGINNVERKFVVEITRVVALLHLPSRNRVFERRVNESLLQSLQGRLWAKMIIQCASKSEIQ